MSRIISICDLLDECYGVKKWDGGLPLLDELIYTILSQNTSASNCNRAYKSLTDSFDMWDAVADATVEEIAARIKVGGLANIKAPRIKNILQQIRSRQGKRYLQCLADLPEVEGMNYLLGFDGVGKKTAACVLMFALGRPVLAVDTHVHRVSMRLGLIGNISADAAHEQLGGIVSADRVYSFHLNMVAHGRQICHARGPKCSECVLRDLCPYWAANKTTKEAGCGETY